MTRRTHRRPQSRGGSGLGGVALAQGPRVAPATKKAKKNPSPADEKTVEQGEKVAKGNPASCVDWTSDRVQEGTGGDLFGKIVNGRGVIPPWKHLPENDRWAVTQYLRSSKK